MESCAFTQGELREYEVTFLDGQDTFVRLLDTLEIPYEHNK